MFKKIHYYFWCLLIVSCGFFYTVNAELATKAEMDQVCNNWMTLVVYENGNWAGDINPRITNTTEIKSGDTLLATIYNIDPGGFIVVPVLKEMVPVKAYSEVSSLDENQEGGFMLLLKEILSSRMALYGRSYGGLDAVQPFYGDAVFGQSQKTRWEVLTKLSDEFKTYMASVLKRNKLEAGPLLTSSWHQRAPYDNLCPMGDGGQCVVGCGATAISQVMNYWQWPPSGRGSHSYYWDGDQSCGGNVGGGQLTVDFSDEYDWENMVDSCDDGCSPDDSAAVAELCYEVGVSINMDYGACGSGSWPFHLMRLYPDFLKYGYEIKDERRPDYELSEWFDLIRHEIDNSRPIQYNVYMHAIVCDGYRELIDGQYEYHMNYGWNNEFTAWFVFDSLYCSWVEPDSLCPAEWDQMLTHIYPQMEPFISLAGYAVSDSEGDNDGVIDIGETIELSVKIHNRAMTVENVTGELVNNDSFISITEAFANFADSMIWDEKVVSETPFVLTVDPACPNPHYTLFELTITVDGGYSTLDTICLYIGDVAGFYDDMESGSGYWTNKQVTLPFPNEWHIEDYRAYGGNYSWKVGRAGSLNYSNLADGGLITPPILLPNDATLSFRHWIDAEAEFDGAFVMISSGDGEWMQITPEKGYPYILFENYTIGLEGGIPSLSGYQNWNQVQFDLSDYSGVVQIMFRFVSDMFGTGEGWYIDDVSVTGPTFCDTVNTGCTRLALGSNSRMGKGTRGFTTPSNGGATMDYAGSGECEPERYQYLCDGSALIGYINQVTGIIHTDNNMNKADDFLILDGLGEADSTTSTADYEVFQTGTILTSDLAFGFEVTSWAPLGIDDCHFIIQRKKVFKYSDVPVSSVRIGDAINWQVPISAAANIGGFNSNYNLIYQQGQNQPTQPGCQDNSLRFGGMAMLGYYYHGDDTVYTDAYGGFVERRSVYVWPSHQFVPAEMMVLMSQPGFRTTPFQEDIFSVITYVADPILEMGDTLYVYSVLISHLNGTEDTLCHQISRARDWAATHLNFITGCCGITTMPGDVNANGIINLLDITYLIVYLYKGGPAPLCYEAADCNGSYEIDILDITYMIRYLYKAGPEPICP